LVLALVEVVLQIPQEQLVVLVEWAFRVAVALLQLHQVHLHKLVVLVEVG
jgi:hypothetical protein